MKIAFIVVSLLLSGCYTKKQYLDNYDLGRKDGAAYCLSAIDKLQREVMVKNERLKKFNQLNSDGSLR